MKFNLTLICAFLMFIGALNAQIIFQDDFESYSDGDRIAQAAANDFWDTWSGNTGGAEDGRITVAQAASGSNSMYISGTNDVLLRVSDEPLESGRYKVTMKLYVQEGRYAYFNLLHFFNGANSSWATQSYFRPNGNGNTDSGGGDAAQFLQPDGEWFDMTFIVDLDDDFSTFYHTDSEVVSWKWSTGAFGAGTSNTFEALNFFAWNNEGTPGFYVDDVVIEQVQKPGDELELLAVLNGDNQVELEWNSSTGASTYILTNHGQVVNTTQDTADLIEKPYPQTFDFRVGAHFDLNGYRFSESTPLELAGGAEREFVLYEIGTGTWCVNCPASARGVDDMHAADYNVGIIEYHGGGTDPFIIPTGTERIGYYSITAYPTSRIDGTTELVGGSFGGNLFATYEGVYDTRMNRRVLYAFDMQLLDLGNNEFKVVVEADELYSYFDGPVNLRIALTESHIPQVWHGLQEVNFVLRDMYPDAAGVELDFSSDNDTYEYTFTLDENYVLENCELVAFLQHDGTQEILNGGVIRLEDASGVNEELSATIKLHPNPVVDEIQIQGLIAGEARIFSQDGKLVDQFIIQSDNHSQPVRKLPSGYYVLKINTDEGIVSKQFIKK